MKQIPNSNCPIKWDTQKIVVISHKVDSGDGISVPGEHFETETLCNCPVQTCQATSKGSILKFSVTPKKDAKENIIWQDLDQHPT